MPDEFLNYLIWNIERNNFFHTQIYNSVKWESQVTKHQQSLDHYISLYSLDEYKKFKEPKLEWWEIDYKINVGENYGVSN